MPVDANGYVNIGKLAEALGDGITAEQVEKAASEHPEIFEEKEDTGAAAASGGGVNTQELADKIKAVMQAGGLPVTAEGWLDVKELITRVPGLTTENLEQVTKEHPETFETKRRRRRRLLRGRPFAGAGARR